MISLDDAGRLAGLLGLIADPVRSRLLFALSTVERLCVGDLALALGVTDDAVSYALRMLRTAGLVHLPERGPGRLLLAGAVVPPSAARALPAPALDRGGPGGRAVSALHALGHALLVSGSMTWEILWALILGFALASIIQAVVRRSTVERLLGDDGPRALVIATGLGAASSSCSYAAVALARALFRKGAGFTAAMVFEIASTNLVVELGIILALLLGWQFTLAEFVGGPLMIVFLALWFRLFLRAQILDAARAQADKGIAGIDGRPRRDGHEHPGAGQHLAPAPLAPGDSPSISHIFVMEWAAVIRDIVIGLLVAGALAAWVPTQLLAALLLHRPSPAVEVVGAADRTRS